LGSDVVVHPVQNDFLEAFEAMPSGTFRAGFGGNGYIVSKTSYSGGKSWKLVAEELGGRDYISLNLYHLKSGACLYPCEMSLDKAIAFVRGATLAKDRQEALFQIAQ
jgi:hypothetical protein